jgi:hypothetical protein
MRRILAFYAGECQTIHMTTIYVATEDRIRRLRGGKLKWCHIGRCVLRLPEYITGVIPL